MSRTRRNFIIAYILLVGLPLLGLAGALRAGRALAAPVSIDGTWNVDADSIHTRGEACKKALSSVSIPGFVISQSGKSLTLTLGNSAKTSGDGILEGNHLKAPLGMTDASAASCAAGQPLLLTAVVDPKSEPRSLSAVVSVDGCASCAATEFHAIRQPKSQGAGGAH